MDDIITRFIDKIKEEFAYTKIVSDETIEAFNKLFADKISYVEYDKTISNPIEIALDFYKKYNTLFYDIIMNGINSGEIKIDSNEDEDASYVDLESNICHIKTIGNDSDIFLIVHELAHYLDIKLNIIPDKTHWKYRECMSFFMEKQLELYLPSSFDNLIVARRTNRIYFERKMLKTINKELYYERLYREKGVLTPEDINEKDAKNIMNRYPYYNLVNYFLVYLVANVISSYLVDTDFNFSKDNFCLACDEAYLSCLSDNFCDRGITSCIRGNRK